MNSDDTNNTQNNSQTPESASNTQSTSSTQNTTSQSPPAASSTFSASRTLDNPYGINTGDIPRNMTKEPSITVITQPLPAPTSPGALLFKGENVTEFLNSWWDLCVDHGVPMDERVRRVSKYCIPSIRGYVESLPEYDSRDWTGLWKVLRKEYIEKDADQQQYTRQYLENYKESAVAKKTELRTYVQHFVMIAKRLVNDRRLDPYTAVGWFLDGLPEDTRRVVMRKGGVDWADVSTFDLDKVHLAARAIVD